MKLRTFVLAGICRPRPRCLRQWPGQACQPAHRQHPGIDRASRWQLAVAGPRAEFQQCADDVQHHEGRTGHQWRRSRSPGFRAWRRVPRRECRCLDDEHEPLPRNSPRRDGTRIPPARKHRIERTVRQFRFRAQEPPVTGPRPARNLALNPRTRLPEGEPDHPQEQT